jgi:hypothetical protein
VVTAVARAIRAPGAALVAGLGLAACDPRSFDRIGDSAWADAHETPARLKSDDYGGAVAFAGGNPDGTAFIAVGRSPSGLVRVAYDAAGGRSLTTFALQDLRFAFDPLPEQPAIAGDPAAQRLLLGLNETGGDGRLVVMDVAGGLENRDFIRVPEADGVATALAIGATDATGDAATLDIVAAGGASLTLVADHAAAAMPVAQSCQLGTGAIHGLHLADVSAAADRDEILASIGTGSAPAVVQVLAASLVELADARRTPQQLQVSCFDRPTRTPLGELAAPGGELDFGTRIVTGDFDGSGPRDLAIAAVSSDKVYVWFDFDPAAPGTPVVLPVPPGAARFGHDLVAGNLDDSDDGRDELVVGAPDATVEETAGAGAAYLYGFSGRTPELRATLHDAVPEEDQSFGRSLALGMFAGARSVLAVGARGEVITYFRTHLEGDEDPRM